MQLKLTGTRVNNLSFQKASVEDDTANSLSFGLFVSWSREEPSKSFSVSFDFKLLDSSGYQIELEYEGSFETEDIVDQEFMDSPWPQVNGAAIVYPYMRAFVSTLTINSGFEPAIIPSVNFQKMYADKVANKIEE